MKRWFAVIALLSWVIAAPVATLYDQLAPSLDKVQSLQSSNPVQALSVLTDAENRFREGATDLPPVLREGVLQSLADAKQALSRKSSTDLSARVQFIKAILGKALYDAYFTALAGGKPQDAAALLPKVLSASGLPDSLAPQVTALAQANNLDNLRRFFERTYAQGIVNALGRAQTQTSASQAYLEATRAYALYLVVQDSPKARGLHAKAFVDALSKLSSGNLDSFKSDAKALSTQAQNFLKSVAPAQSNKRSTAPQVAANPPASGGVSLNLPPAPQSGPVKPKEAAKAPLVVAAKAQPTKPQALSLAAPKTPSIAVTDNRLLSDLTPLIKDPTKAQIVARQVGAAGITSLDEWKRVLLDLRGNLLEAQVRFENGQSMAAKTLLGQIDARYRVAIQPVIQAINPSLAERTVRIFDIAQNAAGLRTTDFSILGGELLENSLTLQGQSLGSFHALEVGLLQTTLGIPRAFLFILAGLLSIFPLYLLGLTFGGRNLYWRYLGLAFFFLLLPAMVEGLSYIGALLASQYGVALFNTLANLSIEQNLVTQLFWGLTLFLAVGFAIVGLRGIATQFGLLQNRRTSQSSQPTNPTLPGQPAKTAKPNPGLTSETIVQWDEEF
ncbi:MAG: hypothetical protein IVW51_15645 [Thermaceae bacterium]|nr:hypothetical protein [Thermaceae bacterium]